MKKKIGWEFWNSPYDPDPKKEWRPESEWEDDREDDVEVDGKVRVVMPTPVGYIPAEVFTSMKKAFNFWVGKLDFDLEDETFDIIERCPGVETLCPISRYRFRIAIGDMFDTKKVLRGIEQALGATSDDFEVENPLEYELTPSMQKRVDAIKAGTDGKSWACLVLPNGQVTSISGRDVDAVHARLETYREVLFAVGGVVFKSEDSQ